MVGLQKGEGFEFDILFWAISVTLIINGSGIFSIDSWLTNKLEQLNSTKIRHKDFLAAGATN
ncbi:MAG TPA: TQO small subunit DoxD [Chitinophagaceae bacterium]|nr:TQO small subunit DoxD [Chitinophagaceae bacterium]